jgi:Tol biopolymer transport system component
MWHPNGKKVAFTTYRNGPFSVYEVPVDLSTPERPLVVRSNDAVNQSYTPDGKSLLYSVLNPETDFDIEVISLEDTTQTYSVVNSRYTQDYAVVHPDGEWIAYASYRTDHYDVYIKQFSGIGGIAQVTVDGGTYPIWARDGSRLYYLKGDMITAVTVETEPQLRIGQPVALFEVPGISSYDVTSDGRFIIVQRTGSDQPQVIAVTNWFEELKKLTGTDK